MICEHDSVSMRQQSASRRGVRYRNDGGGRGQYRRRTSFGTGAGGDKCAAFQSALDDPASSLQPSGGDPTDRID